MSAVAVNDIAAPSSPSLKRKAADLDSLAFDDIADAPVYVPLKKRRAHMDALQRTIQAQNQESDDVLNTPTAAISAATNGDSDAAATAFLSTLTSAPPSPPPLIPSTGQSLVDINAALIKTRGTVTSEEATRVEELTLLAHLTHERAPLLGLHQNALGIRYDNDAPISTGWTVPSSLRKLNTQQVNERRSSHHVIVDGDDVGTIPPILHFDAMRLPKPILAALKAKSIVTPTPIQKQGLPVALTGRDMIGIAFTGSGKTLVFALPMLLFALRAEMKLPLQRGEGPIGMVICPSRELAKQTYDVCQHFNSHLLLSGFPKLNIMLATGGVPFAEHAESLRHGLHAIIATPGRLLDLLTKKRLFLEQCIYLAMDEADRLVDIGFEENIREILDFFHHPRQTVLFSATMPKKVQEFAMSSLIHPIVVNVGRAGAANLDVIQEVEYVKKENKILYLLEVLQKTAPPTLIFTANQADVDDIHEYLLIKGVNTVSIHGGKNQQERNDAIKLFLLKKKDVLVATDVASKGLDFPDIQHVINFDMPKEIEDYVHRIGRTGRRGKTGVATTFINRESNEMTLLDLKHLLQEAKQKVPPFLMTLYDPMEQETAKMMTTTTMPTLNGSVGCAYCGGLGHRVLDCPKLHALNKAKSRDAYGYDRIEEAN